MSFLGERFKQEREARSIAILQVEIDTRIRTNVIQAIEDGDYASLPPAPFLRGLIRSYANYLGVDPQEMLELYNIDIQPIQPSQLKPTPAPSAPPPQPPPTIPQQPPVPMPPSSPSILPPKPQPTLATKPAETNGIRREEIPVTPVLPVQPQAQEPIQPAPIAIEPIDIVEPISVAEISSAPISSVPPPDLPPEMLAPPEHIERPEASTGTELQTLVAYIMQHGLPMPVMVLVAVAILLSCIAGIMLIATQVLPLATSITTARTATPTRIPPTITRTLVPGSGPTSIPTLPVTAAPFPTFPGNPTATPAAPRRTLESTVGLNLDIDVTAQSINTQIGVDGVLVFSGPMATGVSRSWSARDTLYLRVENPVNASIKFNGKPVLPNVFAERTLIERQWGLNERGVPVLETPVPPAAPAGRTPPANPGSPNPTPTPSF